MQLKLRADASVEWDSEEAFAENLTEETIKIPEHLQYYIDYERLANGLFINDYFSGEDQITKYERKKVSFRRN